MDPFIYRECRATISARIPDTPDADAHPDRVLVQGRGTAHPQFQGGSVVFPEIGEYAIPQPIPVVIQDGELMVEVLASDESVSTQPLYLPVTVDERANQNWSWRLVFDFLTLGEYGEEVAHPPLSFPVEAGDGPLEISTVATPAIKSQGFVTRGLPGAGLQEITAEGGELVFQWDNGKTASVPVPDAIPGPPGPPGETRIDSSGIALAVTDTTVQVADKRVMPTGIAISSGADMDAYVEPGFYSVASFTVARSLSNAPKPAIGGNRVFQRAIIEVTRNVPGQVCQKWTTIHPTTQTENPVAERRRDERNVWSEWHRTDGTGVMSPQRYAGSVGAATHQSQEGVLKAIASTTEDRGELWRWIAEPGTLLTVPTHDGSGQSTHPAVMHFPGGWNGWNYWMAHTPYPHSDEAHEDPNIAVSNDGITWTVPDGLVNPLDDQPGKPGPYNSDPHLAMLPDGRMLVSWRMVDRPNGNEVIFYQRTSTDGISWTPKKVLLRQSMVSQSLVWTEGKWRLYGLSGGSLVYFESAEVLPGEDDWSGPISCTTSPPPNGRRWWHGEVQRTGGKWWLVVCDAGVSSNGDGNLYLGSSADGVAWDVSPTPLVPKVGGHYDSIYKSGFVVSGSEIELVYSGYRQDFAEWRLHRTVAKRTSVAGSSDPRGTGVRDLTGMIPEGYSPDVQTGGIWAARVGPLVTLTFQDVVLGGGTSWVNLFNLPLGFRPVADIPSVVHTGDGDQTATTVRPLIVRKSYGRISIGKVDGMRHRGTVTYVTEDPFPE